jgi:hypothetical protein
MLITMSSGMILNNQIWSRIGLEVGQGDLIELVGDVGFSCCHKFLLPVLRKDKYMMERTDEWV